MPPSRRRVLGLGSVVLAGSLAGCASGALKAREDETSADSTTNSGSSSDSDLTTDSLRVDFPDGPKSPPERPADLTAESVREYVRTFERRWVYNHLYSGESTDVRQECAVDSVAEDAEGFRVVVWCSAWATAESDGETVHADYFKQYATYFVRPDSTVRRDGELKTRR